MEEIFQSCNVDQLRLTICSHAGFLQGCVDHGVAGDIKTGNVVVFMSELGEPPALDVRYIDLLLQKPGFLPKERNGFAILEPADIGDDWCVGGSRKLG